MNTSKRLALLGALSLSLMILSIPELLAVGDEQLMSQIGKAERVVRGGYLRLALFGACAFTAIVSIVKQNIMGVVIAIGSAFGVHLMMEWINTTFTAGM